MNWLTDQERIAIIKIAAQLPTEVRDQLLADVDVAAVSVTNTDRSMLEFHIPAYDRPAPQTGQRSFGPEGEVTDRDGEKLSVVVYADRNGRLLEFELIRYADGDVIEPQWTTFNLV